MHKFLHKNKMYLQERLQELKQKFIGEVADRLTSGLEILNRKSDVYSRLGKFNPDELEFFDYLISQGLDNVPRLVRKQYEEIKDKDSLDLETFVSDREALLKPETVEAVVFKEDDKIGLLLPISCQEVLSGSSTGCQKSLFLYSAKVLGESRIIPADNASNFMGFFGVYGIPDGDIYESAINLVKKLNDGEIPDFKGGNLNLYVSDLGYSIIPMNTVLKPNDFLQEVAKKYDFDPNGEYTIKRAAEIIGITDESVHTTPRYKSLITLASPEFMETHHNSRGKSVKGKNLLDILARIEKGEIKLRK